MSQDTTMRHRYVSRSNNDEPYFFGTPGTLDDGIADAEGALKDCRSIVVRACLAARQHTVKMFSLR